jgi:hypothetical protein
MQQANAPRCVWLPDMWAWAKQQLHRHFMGVRLMSGAVAMSMQADAVVEAAMRCAAAGGGKHGSPSTGNYAVSRGAVAVGHTVRGIQGGLLFLAAGTPVKAVTEHSGKALIGLG